MLAKNWDSFQEALLYRYGGLFAETLASRKKAAEESNDDGGEAVPLAIGAEVMMIEPFGAKGGFKFILRNDDFIVMLGSPKKDWCCTVRYLAAGLWEHGLATLQERVYAMLRSQGKLEGEPIDFARVTRCDFAMDFYSPTFTTMMTPALANQIVAHSEVKSKAHVITDDTASRGEEGSTFYVRAGRIETLTIGKKNNVQVEVYNKGLEIIEASGKEWMFKMWGDGPWMTTTASGKPKAVDVWRLEVRMGKKFLKERNCRVSEHVNQYRDMLVGEALLTRRLTVEKWRGDSNRRRWPLHPLWQIAREEVGVDELLPYGRFVTGRRRELVDRNVAGGAGTIRSTVVLNDQGELTREAAEAVAMKMVDVIFRDPRLAAKVDEAERRYSHVDEAR